MKMIENIILILVFTVISCERDTEIKELNIFPENYKIIVGSWHIRSITGGLTGTSYEPNFEIMQIEANGKFKFLYGENVLATGQIVIEEIENKNWLKYILDDGYTIGSVNMALYFPKYVHTLKGDLLILADPCCDLYTYEFGR